ncbi:organomercurial transporter MerC [Variovorax soli]|uniref:organomercurial transporter MerC n=1 Tax=Variovorax soli TaxID=376815 RepID=UPI00083958F6|nr:organomercurial transporter MerC [Variovorax soli]
MGLVARIGDKAGALGSVVSAMGCAGCFPAIGSFGGAIGLGFLSQYEGLFITVLLPLFAALALLANALGWLSHRQWHRSVLGMVGPVIVLVAAYTMAEKLLYAGLAIMIGVSVWDLLAPAHRKCAPDSTALPQRQ